MSGSMKPSTPARADSEANLPYPMLYAMLAYVIITTGVSAYPRMSRTILWYVSMDMPAPKDAVAASWMTGPSASGSVNGNPSSMRSAPPRTRPRTAAMLESWSG